MNDIVLRLLAATGCAALLLTACGSEGSSTTNAGTTGSDDSDSNDDSISISVTLTDTSLTSADDADSTVGPTDTTDDPATTTDAPTTTDTSTTTDASTSTDATTGTETDSTTGTDSGSTTETSTGGAAACDPLDIAADLDGTEEVFNRPGGGSFAGNCSLSELGNAVSFDVYDFELTGPGPHDLTADMCTATEFDSMVFIYQAADGGADPFDPTDACANLITSDDDTCMPASLAEAADLVEGTVQIVVTSFDNDVTGNYSLSVSSTTCL